MKHFLKGVKEVIVNFFEQLIEQGWMWCIIALVSYLKDFGILAIMCSLIFIGVHIGAKIK